MQAGRKPLPNSVKKARGTFQPARSNEEIPVPNTAPTMPAYLTAEAKKVWVEELPRVMECKVTDVDSSLFARYCAVEALVRDLLRNGDVPQGNLLTELRRMGECLGLTGPSSRIARGGKDAQPTNPFAALLKPNGTN